MSADQLRRKAAPQSRHREIKMDDFKGSYYMPVGSPKTGLIYHQMDITEKEGIWTIRISTDDIITDQRFKVNIILQSK